MSKFHGKVPTMKDIRRDEAKRELTLEEAATRAKELLKERTIFDRSRSALLCLQLLGKFGRLPQPVLCKAMGISAISGQSRAGWFQMKETGYVKAEKGRFDSHSVYWLSLTEKGKEELRKRCQKKKT